MKKYLEPAMEVIALQNTNALLAGSTPGLGGSLSESDEILAPGMDSELPDDNLLKGILPVGMP